MKNKIKNEDRAKHIFIETINRKEFLNKLQKLKDSWDLDQIPSYKFYYYQLENAHKIKNYKKFLADLKKSKNKINSIKKAIKKCHDKFIETYNKESHIQLRAEVEELLKEYSLGKNYVKQILDLLIAGYEKITYDMFYICPLDECKKNKSIIIEINRNTSLEDIKEKWSIIEDLKKKIWPKSKTKRITVKSINNLRFLLLSKFIKTKNDAELVTKIWPDGEAGEDLYELGKLDKRKINRIRQIKSRAKRVKKNDN